MCVITARAASTGLRTRRTPATAPAPMTLPDTPSASLEAAANGTTITEASISTSPSALSAEP